MGQDKNPEQRFSDLEIWARHALDMTAPVSMKWSGQIIEPVDGLAYIGRTPGQEHIYMCTGDSGHGVLVTLLAKPRTPLYNIWIGFIWKMKLLNIRFYLAKEH